MAFGWKILCRHYKIGKEKRTTEDRIDIQKVVTDIVPLDLLDRIALERRFLGVPTTREISLT